MSKAIVKRWGNSLAIRIPKTEVDRFGITDGSQMEIISEPDQLILRPSLKNSGYSLDDLLLQVTDANIHGEVEWGVAIGREKLDVWNS